MLPCSFPAKLALCEERKRAIAISIERVLWQAFVAPPGLPDRRLRMAGARLARGTVEDRVHG